MKKFTTVLFIAAFGVAALADCCSYLTGATTDCADLQYPLEGGFGILKKCFVRSRSASGSFDIYLGRRTDFTISSYTNGNIVSSNYRQTRRLINGDFIRMAMTKDYVLDMPVMESGANFATYAGEDLEAGFYYGKISDLYGETNAYWQILTMYQSSSSNTVDVWGRMVTRMTNDTYYADGGIVMKKTGIFEDLNSNSVPRFVSRETGVQPDTKWRVFSKSYPCEITVTTAHETKIGTCTYTDGTCETDISDVVLTPRDYLRCTSSGVGDGSVKVGLVYETGSR